MGISKLLIVWSLPAGLPTGFPLYATMALLPSTSVSLPATVISWLYTVVPLPPAMALLLATNSPLL